MSLLYKILGIIALVTMLAAAARTVIYEHDKRVLSDVAAKEAALNLITERQDAKNLAASLEAWAEDAESRANSQTPIKEAISRASPSSFSCVRSSAGRAALGGLRGDLSGHASPPASAPIHTEVPATDAPSHPRHRL